LWINDFLFGRDHPYIELMEMMTKIVLKAWIEQRNSNNLIGVSSVLSLKYLGHQSFFYLSKKSILF